MLHAIVTSGVETGASMSFKIHFPKLQNRLSSFVVAGLIASAPMAQADQFVSPDIVILGDSQIPFGSGPVFLEFFENIKAQANIKRAFAKTGAACTFIEGATPETVQANQGNKHYFRLNKSGKVKDPYHPNLAAAKNFFAIEMGDICSAIYAEISDAMPDPT